MEYLWLVILVAIILKFIGRQPVGRQSRRYRPRGKFDLPRQNLPDNEEDVGYNEEEMPYAQKEIPYGRKESPPDNWSSCEPAERWREADIQVGQVGRDDGLIHAAAESGFAGNPQVPAAIGGPRSGKHVEPEESCSNNELFADGLNEQELIKGVVWSQILGSRAGIQGARRLGRHNTMMQ